MCNVLLIDHDSQSIKPIEQYVEAYFANVILFPAIQTYKQLDNIIKKHKIEIAIINTEIGIDCFDLHKRLVVSNPNTKSILFSSRGEFKIAQKALRYGIVDYLLTPIGTDFIYALDRAIQSINQISLLNVRNNHNTSRSFHLKNRILRYIHDQYAEDISLVTLSDYLHLSRDYTSRLVKDTLGMTFSLYLLIYRIEVAKKELSTSDLTVNEIAHRVGFNEPNYFSKKFKEVVHLTPTQYKKTYSGVGTIITSGFIN
ncbi:hypothetical protein IGI37_001504 [Enterococcus sp. AZ194]|uniref:response regulator transcription factor n=1 Tax=Enterococcus sp. AZ194 TaxID=2774629 RepID=UPI003F201F93